MIQQINTLDDAAIFAESLLSEGLNFHPDENFNNYINLITNIPSYTEDEACKRNSLMKQCFEICNKQGVDIYAYMHNIALERTGLDKFIPYS